MTSSKEIRGLRDNAVICPRRKRKRLKKVAKRGYLDVILEREHVIAALSSDQLLHALGTLAGQRLLLMNLSLASAVALFLLKFLLAPLALLLQALDNVNGPSDVPLGACVSRMATTLSLEVAREHGRSTRQRLRKRQAGSSRKCFAKLLPPCGSHRRGW